MITVISLVTGALFSVAGLGLIIASVFTYDDPNVTTATYTAKYSMLSVLPIGIAATALSIATQNPKFLILNALPIAVFFGLPVIKEIKYIFNGIIIIIIRLIDILYDNVDSLL